MEYFMKLDIKGERWKLPGLCRKGVKCIQFKGLGIKWTSNNFDFGNWKDSKIFIFFLQIVSNLPGNQKSEPLFKINCHTLYG